jgi:hypothetical protein
LVKSAKILPLIMVDDPSSAAATSDAAAISRHTATQEAAKDRII